MHWADTIATLLWRSSWAAIPFVLLVAAVCKWTPCRPGTRHTLWVIALGSFLAPLLSLFVPLPNLLPNVVDSDADVAIAQDAEHDSANSLTEYLVDEEHSPAVAQDLTKPIPVPDLFASNSELAESDPEALTVEEEALLREYFDQLIRETEQQNTAKAAASRDRASFVPAYWFGRFPSTWQQPRGESRVADTKPVEPSAPVAAVAPTPTPAPTPAASRDVSVNQESDQPAPPAPAIVIETQRDLWIAGLARVRDALAGLPSLPVGFWLAGLAGMILFYLVGALRFRSRMSRSETAPRDVTRMVERVSRRIGLRRSPETLMLDEPVSPLVWCGRRTRLVLPTGLWGELDPIGRQAILCHELAHLRRRDHWVRRLELLLSALFWWNPLVWWIRRRVEEEADHCCDAWVTWLMPRRRRAYAEALLATREHISAGGRTVPAIVMGATSPKAKSFARRIKMVMTQSSRPGLSVMGIGLALSLAIVGWIATPAWSCPNAPSGDPVISTAIVCDEVAPSEKAAKCEKVVVCDKAAPHAQAGTCVVTAPTCQSSPTCKTVVIDGKTGATMPSFSWVSDGSDDGERHEFIVSSEGKRSARNRSRSSRGDDDLEARMARLERAMEKLNRLLEKQDRLFEKGKVEVVVPKIAPVRPVPPVPAVPPVQNAPHAGTWIWKDGELITPPNLEPGLNIAIQKANERQKTVSREYKLPKGKLEALTKLMVREDVPVLVTPGDDSITVHGTARQQKIFKAFVNLINPSDENCEVEDVQVLIGMGDDGEVIDLSGIQNLHGWYSSDFPQVYSEAMNSYKDVMKLYGKQMRDMPDLAELKLEGLGNIHLELQSQLEEQASQLEKQAAELEAQAAELAQQAEAMAEKQPRRARELERTIRELERKAERLERMADKLDQQMEEEEEPEL